MTEKLKPFRIRVIEDSDNDIPEGASILVNKETKRLYKGFWPFGPMTLFVSIKKKYCELDPDSDKLDASFNHTTHS